MRAFIVLLALAILEVADASPARNYQYVLRAPPPETTAATAARKLYGRFLHITDLHVDPFYKVHSSTGDGIACHRGSGPAGTYGAETSDCDSPYTLINETFKWIENNLRDTIDFVVWTGDSARHDSDENIPRTEEQVLNLNKYVVGKFAEVFGTGKDEIDDTKEMIIPIIPTFGNNDILPHNILLAGPNKWLRGYTDLWRQFIPEEQKHSFQRGGWFSVEVIPQKLAVFSLNTLYFFDHNTAVDGCAAKSEPGWEHMEWLRIQLQFMRERGMKAILMGHVPPARTESKQLWDETCWQKYTLWLQQYRDVVVGGLYGHMNIDHFSLQDTKDINLALVAGLDDEVSTRAHLDDELTFQSAADYLEELRDGWSKLPDLSVVMSSTATTRHDDLVVNEKKKKKKGKKGKKSEKDKALKKIGGPWGERFQVTNIGPSVVPNFFPTLRVIEYNITGLEGNPTWGSMLSSKGKIATIDRPDDDLTGSLEDLERIVEISNEDSSTSNIEDGDTSINKKKKHKKPKGDKERKHPKLGIPLPPSKSSPPGPAYSPQTLTLLGYTQYFANLTHINNDLVHDTVDLDSWHEGKHKDKHPKDKKPYPKKFAYEIEYSTFSDSQFKLKDMTVKSYLKLAHRIGQYEPPKGDRIEWDEEDKDTPFKEEDDDDVEDEEENILEGQETLLFSTFSEFVDGVSRIVEHYTDIFNAWLVGESLESYIAYRDADDQEIKKNGDGYKGGHKKKKGHKKRNKNKAWLAFIKRAFVGTLDDNEIKDFQLAREQAILRGQEEDL